MALAKPKQQTPDLQTQVLRLATFDRQFSVSEYERVLASVAVSSAHAKAIMDRVMDTADELPMPGRFREIAGTVPVPGAIRATTCGQCIEGWVVVTVRGVEGVRQCKCRKDGG